MKLPHSSSKQHHISVRQAIRYKKFSIFFPVWIFNFQLSLCLVIFSSSPSLTHLRSPLLLFFDIVAPRKMHGRNGRVTVYMRIVDIGKKWAAAAIFYSSLNNDYFFYRLYFQFLFYKKKHNHDVWNSFFLCRCRCCYCCSMHHIIASTTKVAKRENEEKLKNARLDIVKGGREQKKITKYI